MKLSLTLAATLSLIGAVHAQRPSIERPTFPRPSQSLGSFLQADEPTPTEIGTPEPRTDDNTATPGASPESDIESRPLSKLSAGQTGTAKPLQPEKLIPNVAMNLAVVVGTMVLLAFAWKTLKKSPRRSKSPVESESGLPTRLEVEDQLRLAGGQTLYSVRHGGRAFLIGSTPQTLSLLADLSAPAAKPTLTVTPASSAAPVAERPAPVASAEPRRPKPAPVETPAQEESVDRFSGILDRLRAQESAGAIASALNEPVAEAPAAPARRRSLFDGGSR